MKKIQNTKQLSEEILAPMVKHCAEKRGEMSRALKLYNKGLAEPIPLSTIQRWLNKYDTKRVPPNGGALLRLIESWKTIREPDCINVPEATIYCCVNGHTPCKDGICKRCKIKI